MVAFLEFQQYVVKSLVEIKATLADITEENRRHNLILNELRDFRKNNVLNVDSTAHLKEQLNLPLTTVQEVDELDIRLQNQKLRCNTVRVKKNLRVTFLAFYSKMDKHFA